MYSTDLSAIETEIHRYLATITQADRTSGQAALEIGKRLHYVKKNGMVHGDWLAWLFRVDLEKGYAQRCMRAAEQFGNNPRAAFLTATQLFELNALPGTVDRTTFLETEHAIPSTGELKLVEDMKRDEIRQVVRAERERAGIARPSRGRQSALATPYIDTVVQSLQNLSVPIAQRLEDGKITFQQAVHVGSELNDEQQMVLAELLDYEREEGLPAFNDLVAIIANGVQAETLRQSCEIVYELSALLSEFPQLSGEVGRASAELSFSCAPTDEELSATIVVIRTKIAHLRKTIVEEMRRAERARKEQERTRATFGRMFSDQLRELGLAAGASFDDVRRKYRELVRRLHPDVNGGQDDEFKRVKAAYDDLNAHYNSWREPLHI